MSAIFVVLAALGFGVWRSWQTVGPWAKRLGSVGAELGGWTLFFDSSAGRKATRTVTSSARVMLWGIAIVVALFSSTLRLIVLGYLAWKGYRLHTRVRANRIEWKQSGFEVAAERDLVAQAVREAMIAMNLGSKAIRNGMPEVIPPRMWGWKRLPVLVGGKPLKGAYRYECKIEPAPGKGVPSIMGQAGRGLDADEDPIRDAVNSMLRSARGPKVKQVRQHLGAVPQFTLSTVEQLTRKGEKIGVAKLTLWSTDPFRRKVSYPYNPAKPVVEKFTDRVPVGLKRSNAEAKLMLNRHTSVQGINGSGKSSIVRPALIAAAHTDALIGVMAMKGPHDYQDLADRFIGGTVVVERQAVINVLRWADGEIHRRNSLPAADRAALPHLLLVLDEGQELEDDISLIVPIVKKGRSAKVWLWSVTQYGLSSIIPSEAAREMGQRYAGRIEGGVTQAQVAVGSRASKSAGPHLIPEDPRWVGVLFGSDGEYLRAYWVSAESLPGEPKSDLAKCAAALRPRPDDPEGYMAAADGAAPRLAVVAATHDKAVDGCHRTRSGEATAIDFSKDSALPREIRAAAQLAWTAVQERLPERQVHVTKVLPVLTRAADTVPEAVDRMAGFLNIQIPQAI